QMDIGDFKVKCENGDEITVYALIMVLGFSRHMYVEFVERAYRTNDSDTFDPNFYQLHLAKWKDYCQKIKQEVNRGRRTETSVSIDYGLL
ncbi:MAG: hypothetical protein HQK96_15435, partial [Nitrospirae bacterium]|nr:hypothetical protein [Nitrospirota bacterium]